MTTVTNVPLVYTFNLFFQTKLSIVRLTLLGSSSEEVDLLKFSYELITAE